MNANRQVTSQEAEQFIKSVDINNDKTVSKEELLQIFKKVVSSNKWSS